MRIWALIAQKGGVGKTMLATQLGAYGCQCGETVLIIDLDRQASASHWHEERGKGESPLVIQCLPEKLGKLIEAAREMNAYSLIILDTPPHTDSVAVAAIRATDLIICPTKPGLSDMKALQDTASVILLADAMPRAIGVVNECDNAKVYGKTSEKIENLGMRVAGSYVRDLVDFGTAFDQGKAVTEIAPKGKAASDIVKLWGELNNTWPVVVPETEETKA